MTDQDKDRLGARIQELLRSQHVDPQELRRLAKEKASQLAQVVPSGASMEQVDEVAADLPENIRTLGKYRLLELLGRGGTGKVYKARNTENNQLVAIKVLASQSLADEQRLLRFYMEAKAASSLEHPNIVRIHEVSEQDEYHFMVMDYVEGIELSELIEKEPLAPDTAARIIMVIARVIDYVHRQGILHRDLKPSNIMIDTQGQILLTDFGVAKLKTGLSSVTTTGMLLGTPSYMPPEQVEGKSDTLGPACDVYSMGAVLYELLTGEPPFQGDSPYDTLRKVLHHLPKSPRSLQSTIPKNLESICLKCLEKDPAHRYTSAAALADELEAYLGGENIRPHANLVLRQALRSSTPSPARLCGPEVMERWSRILQWNAILWLSLVLAVYLLSFGETADSMSFKLLWLVGGSLIFLTSVGYRIKGSLPITPVERQTMGVLVAFVLTGAVLFLLYRWFPIPAALEIQWTYQVTFLLLLAALFFGCLVVMVDGSFLCLALLFLAMPFLYVLGSAHFLLVLAAALGVGFYIPARRFSQDLV